jgi:3-hydroxybutyryl-CoA dehydrogenase
MPEQESPGTRQRLAILGAGVIGTGIAQVALQAGKHVILWDADAQAASRAAERISRALQTAAERGRLSAADREAALGRLALATTLEAACAAPLLIEAVPDVLAEKRTLFRSLDALCGPDVVLATSTSTQSVTRIAATWSHPGQVLGMHFFNPVPAIRLVEIVRGLQTSQETFATAWALAGEIGKTPVEARNRPGFIVNRVAHAYTGEALQLLEEGVASKESVDGLLRGMGFKLGPFELLDLVGLDVNLALTTAIYDATFGEPRFRPHPLQAEMVHAGQTGRKARKGFYAYPSE